MRHLGPRTTPRSVRARCFLPRTLSAWTEVPGRLPGLAGTTARRTRRWRRAASVQTATSSSTPTRTSVCPRAVSPARAWAPSPAEATRPGLGLARLPGGPPAAPALLQPLCLEPCQAPSLTPRVLRGFLFPVGRQRPWLGWVGAGSGLRGHILVACGLCHQATNPQIPSDPPSPFLPACVGPDGFPKFVSVSTLAQAGGGREHPTPRAVHSAWAAPWWGWCGHRVYGLTGCSGGGGRAGTPRADPAKLSTGACPAAGCSSRGWGAVREPWGTLSRSVPARRAVGQQLPGL